MPRSPRAAGRLPGTVWRPPCRLLPLLALVLTACAGGSPAGGPTAPGLATEGLAARLPAELFGLRRGATEAFALPRLGPALTVRYAPEAGGAVASILLVARGEPDLAGEDPRQPAAAAEFDRMLAEAVAFGEAGGPAGRVLLQEQFVVAVEGRPMVRCARLVEAGADGTALNGLRCLGVARDRFVRVFLTAAPGAMELRRAAGFAALATAVLQEGSDAGPTLPHSGGELGLPPAWAPAPDASPVPGPWRGAPRLYRT